MERKKKAKGKPGKKKKGRPFFHITKLEKGEKGVNPEQSPKSWSPLTQNADEKVESRKERATQKKTDYTFLFFFEKTN